MFLYNFLQFQPNAQALILILNTALLIVGLIVVELIYTDKPKHERRVLRLFYPIAVVLVAIFAVAVYKQVGGQG